MLTFLSETTTSSQDSMIASLDSYPQYVFLGAWKCKLLQRRFLSEIFWKHHMLRKLTICKSCWDDDVTSLQVTKLFKLLNPLNLLTSSQQRIDRLQQNFNRHRSINDIMKLMNNQVAVFLFVFIYQCVEERPNKCSHGVMWCFITKMCSCVQALVNTDNACRLQPFWLFF